MGQQLFKYWYTRPKLTRLSIALLALWLAGALLVLRYAVRMWNLSGYPDVAVVSDNKVSDARRKLADAGVGTIRTMKVTGEPYTHIQVQSSDFAKGKAALASTSVSPSSSRLPAAK
jgi:hypothetical protein